MMGVRRGHILSRVKASRVKATYCLQFSSVDLQMWMKCVDSRWNSSKLQTGRPGRAVRPPSCQAHRISICFYRLASEGLFLKIWQVLWLAANSRFFVTIGWLLESLWLHASFTDEIDEIFVWTLIERESLYQLWVFVVAQLFLLFFKSKNSHPTVFRKRRKSLTKPVFSTITQLIRLHLTQDNL